jgi:hypothetical protein
MCNAVPAWLPAEPARSLDDIAAAFAALIVDGARQDGSARRRSRALSRRSMARDSIGR